MEITQQVWGMTPEGDAIILYTMRNSHGAEVLLTNIGASIVGVRVPDRKGHLADVALGYDNPMSYFGDGAAMGKSVGRFANRIGHARFELDGAEYLLPRNKGVHHLHGGDKGFANRLWTGRVEGDRVVFGYVSADGEEGYPGELGAEVVYDWDDNSVLEITMFARSNKPTIVNFTNHSYWNLAGESSGSVLDHELTLHADYFLGTNDDQICMGPMVCVEGTPMDFRVAKPLGRDIEDAYPPLRQGFGYDHCWVVKGGTAFGVASSVVSSVSGAIVADSGASCSCGAKALPASAAVTAAVLPAAELYDPASGRYVRFSTDQPGVQVYAGNFLAGGPMGKSGRPYADRDGVALECQGLPNSPNVSTFPSQRLNPDETYERHIKLEFGTK